MASKKRNHKPPRTDHTTKKPCRLDNNPIAAAKAPSAKSSGPRKAATLNEELVADTHHAAAPAATQKHAMAQSIRPIEN